MVIMRPFLMSLAGPHFRQLAQIVCPVGTGHNLIQMLILLVRASYSNVGVWSLVKGFLPREFEHGYEM